jgi:hypothetical protein
MLHRQKCVCDNEKPLLLWIVRLPRTAQGQLKKQVPGEKPLVTQLVADAGFLFPALLLNRWKTSPYTSTKNNGNQSFGV